jgi:hypothetical protein
MAKVISNRLYKISTVTLRKAGFFKGLSVGSLTWERSDGKVVIDIEASTIGDNYLRLQYPMKDQQGREAKQIDYKMHLVSTPCRFGGKRFWLICPASVRDNYCGRRVSVLYRYGDYFACRHCHNVTYASRNLSGKHKTLGYAHLYANLDYLRRLQRHTHYRGIVTRRYRQYLRIEQKVFDSYKDFLRIIGEKIKKYIPTLHL